MSEPKRVQIVRSHQNAEEFAIRKSTTVPQFTGVAPVFTDTDYYQLGWQRLATVQSLPLRENWPIVCGNALGSFSSGVVGSFIIVIFTVMISQIERHASVRLLICSALMEIVDGK